MIEMDSDELSDPKDTISGLPISSIAKLLSDEKRLLDNLSLVYDELDLQYPQHQKTQWFLGFQTNYELVKHMLSEWLSLRGRRATLPSLSKTLKTLGFMAVVGK